jgi:dihydropteroate synthase
VGGESTRPGAAPITPQQEQDRIIPVIEALTHAGLVVSADTRHAATMQAALDAGARIINDVSGLTFDPAALELVASRGCPVVLMHMRGTPQTMNALARYDDVVEEVAGELQARLSAALMAGVAQDRIALDPGIGFAKHAPQSRAILRALPRIAALGCPVLVGLSRKSVIGHFSGEADAARRLGGSIAGALFAVERGASILRVHDVRETVQAIRVWQALSDSGTVSLP